MASEMNIDRGLLPQETLASKATWNISFHESIRGLERAADKIWKMVDECVSFSAIDEAQYVNNKFEALRSMRKAHAVSVDVLRTLCIFAGNMNERINELDEKTKNMECHITQTALNYGLQRLPDEVLSEILFYVATGIKHTVALSHVCRRFRSVVISCPEIWAKFKLLSYWPPEQTRAFAERSGVLSLKGVIVKPRDTPDSIESLKAFLSLSSRLEDLRIEARWNSFGEELQQYSNGFRWPVLHTLWIIDDIPSIHFYDPWEMPALRVLDATFVPRPTLGSSLVRCSLHLYKRQFRVKELADFLSSSNLLQELHIEFPHHEKIDGLGTVNLLGPVALPSLVSLDVLFDLDEFERLVDFLVEKMSLSAILKLKLYIDVGENSMQALHNSLSRFLLASTSLQELTLEVWPREHTVDIGFIFKYMPRHVETLSLQGVNLIWDCGSEPFMTHSLRRLHFCNCSGIPEVVVPFFLELRQTAGDISITFEFYFCRKMKDGTSTLDSLESALDDS